MQINERVKYVGAQLSLHTGKHGTLREVGPVHDRGQYWRVRLDDGEEIGAYEQSLEPLPPSPNNAKVSGSATNTEE